MQIWSLKEKYWNVFALVCLLKRSFGEHALELADGARLRDAAELWQSLVRDRSLQWRATSISESRCLCVLSIWTFMPACFRLLPLLSLSVAALMARHSLDVE